MSTQVLRHRIDTWQHWQLEREYEDTFTEWLDECYEPVEWFGMTFRVSRVIRDTDPEAYNQIFLDWLDGMCDD